MERNGFVGFMNLIWLLNFLMVTELHITSFISLRVQDFEHCLKSVWRKDKASLCAVYICSAPSEELVFSVAMISGHILAYF